LIIAHFALPSELFNFMTMAWVLIIIQLMALIYKVTNRD